MLRINPTLACLNSGVAAIALLFILNAHAALNDKKLESTFSPMNQQKMESIIRAASEKFAGGGSMMEFQFNGVTMACISDTRHDRMRIISPVANEKDLHEKQYKILMESNFHLALDSRYALSNGVLYAAFIHPLSSLHPAELESALRQVSQLVKTFGTSYSSGELSFGGNRQQRKSRPAVP